MGESGLELLNNAKIGIVVGSFLSGLIGYLMLNRYLPKSNTDMDDDDELENENS